MQFTHAILRHPIIIKKVFILKILENKLLLLPFIASMLNSRLIKVLRPDSASNSVPFLHPFRVFLLFQVVVSKTCFKGTRSSPKVEIELIVKSHCPLKGIVRIYKE